MTRSSQKTEMRIGCRGAGRAALAWACAMAGLVPGGLALRAGAQQAGPVAPAGPAPAKKKESSAISFQSGTPADAPASNASLYGTVMGPNGGLAAGAGVVLSGKVVRTATTAGNGSFSFTGLPAGTYRLSVSGRGMKMVSMRHIVLTPGAVRFLPQITLEVKAAAATVTVMASPEQLAEQQLQIQLHQKVLGIVPNYYSSYNWNAEHLWPRQKFELAFKAEIDPVTFVVIGAEAGIEQEGDRFPAYGQGVEGYAKRYGAAYANDFIGAMIGDALLPSVFHQDPRYFYKGKGSFMSRAMYAVSRSVLCRGDDKQTEFDYSRVIGDFASGAISNAYYPAGSRGAELVVSNGLIDIGGNAATNLIREFVLPALTSHAPEGARKSSIHLF